MNSKDHNTEQEAEKKLKDAMDELSSSVNCFDRIAARAFSEEDEDFCESGSVVRGTETMSGTRRALPVLRITAIAAAAALCIGVLPKSPLVRDFLSGFGEDKKVYRELTAEISRETSGEGFRVYDMPLEEYISNDVMITPLFPCPFSKGSGQDTNVRIFIKMCGDMPTNEVFAVEYAGTYTESNFIAVADSGVRMSGEDIRAGEDMMKGDINPDSDFLNKSLSSIFSTDSGNTAAASFTYPCVYKKGKTIYPVLTDVVCYAAGDELPAEHYGYDMSARIYDSGEAFTLPERDKAWAEAVCYDESRAVPEKNGSDFERAVFTESESQLPYVEMFWGLEEPVYAGISNYFEMGIITGSSEDVKYSVPMPYAEAALRTFRVYSTYTEMFSDKTAFVRVNTDDGKETYLDLPDSDSSITFVGTSTDIIGGSDEYFAELGQEQDILSDSLEQTDEYISRLETELSEETEYHDKLMAEVAELHKKDPNSKYTRQQEELLSQSAENIAEYDARLKMLYDYRAALQPTT